VAEATTENAMRVFRLKTDGSLLTESTEDTESKSF